jgi:hypothetical protein
LFDGIAHRTAQDSTPGHSSGPNARKHSCRLRSHTGPGKERAHSVSPGPTGGYSTNGGYSSRDFAYDD